MKHYNTFRFLCQVFFLISHRFFSTGRGTPTAALAEKSLFPTFHRAAEAGDALALDSGDVGNGAGDQGGHDDQKQDPRGGVEVEPDDTGIHSLNEEGNDLSSAVEVDGPFRGDGNAVLQNAAVVADDGKDAEDDIGNIGYEGHIQTLERNELEAIVLNTDLFGIAGIPGHGVEQHHIEKDGKDGGDEEKGIILVGCHGEHKAEHGHTNLVDHHLKDQVRVFFQKVHHNRRVYPFGEHGLTADVVGRSISLYHFILSL